MKYYDHIAKLPLSAFIECLCDNNLRALVIEEDPENKIDEYILQGAWIDIQEQYAEVMGDAEQRIYLKYVREINCEITTLHQVHACIEILEKVGYNDYFAEELSSLLKMKFTFNTSDLTSYNTTLQRAKDRIPGLEMRIELKQFQIDELEQRMKKKEGSKPTRGYFARVMNAVEEYYSVPIDEKITTLRFCDKVIRMVKSNEKNKGNGSRKR